MSACPKCGYELAPLELECPRCRREETQKQVLSRLSPDLLGPGKSREQPPSRAELVAEGTTVGATYGALALILIMLVDRYVFHATVQQGPSLLALLCISAPAGVVLGALVGLAVSLRRAPVAGIVVGALLLAVLRGMGLGAPGNGDVGILTWVGGLVYGGIFGAAVATVVLNVLRQAR